MEIIYLDTVKNFIRGLDSKTKSKINVAREFLKEKEYKLEMPLSRALGDGLFELRLLGNVSVRLIYCFHNGSIYVIHGIIKKSQKLDNLDLEYARKIKIHLHSDSI